MHEHQKILYIVMVVITLVLIGTFGYYLMTDLGLFESFYMTVITISTVGFTEVGELTTTGRLFTIFLIFSGLSVVFYAFTNITAFLVEGELKSIFRRKSMEGKISRLQGHYILCGAGETGHSVIEQFVKRQAHFVIIEKDEDKVKDLVDQGFLAVRGDASQESVLRQARIEHAKGLVAALPSDADNVLIVLTARELNKQLYIVARAIDKNADVKLKRAGANNTISPNVLGGRRMASLLLRPTVVSFLDVITQAGEDVLDLEDIIICRRSDLVGKTLANARIPEKTGLIVLALKKAGDTELSLNPNSNEHLEEGDTMLVLGKGEQVDQLRKLACDNRP